MKKVPWYETLCYGISSWGGCLSTYLAAGYLTLFATDVMGVEAAAVGVLFLICELFDAVTDILITNVADKTHTRWGKYRPWLLFTGIPLAVTLVVLFWNPGFLQTQGQKLTWLFVGYFLLSPICITGYLCPQYVMLSVITSDEGDRMRLGSARSVGEFAAELMVNALCMTLVLLFGAGDYRSSLGWRAMAGVFGALTLVGSLCGFLGTRERVHISNQNTQGDPLTLWEKLKLLGGSSAYKKTLAMNVGLMLAVVETVLFSYFCIYNLGHEDWVAPLCTLGSVVSMAAAALLPGLGRRMGERGMITLGCCLLLLSAGLYLVAESFAVMALMVICKGLGYGLTISCCGILWATTADHIESQSGIAIPGMVMASGSFVQKILMGLCTFLGTLVLSLGGYDAQAPVQSARTLGWIRYGIAGFLALAALAALLANLSLTEFQKESQKP